jgi:hypothetical protein
MVECFNQKPGTARTASRSAGHGWGDWPDFPLFGKRLCSNSSRPVELPTDHSSLYHHLNTARQTHKHRGIHAEHAEYSAQTHL